MTGTALFSADIEHRGMVLDPRTKLAIILTLVIFVLGGTGGDIRAVRIAAAVLSLLPAVLMLTAGQWKKAVVYGAVFGGMLTLQKLACPELKGAALSIAGMCVMVFVRLMPGLAMGAYTLSNTTVSEFIAAMHRMHVPQQITIPLSVMFRFFPTVLEEFSAINTAMKMRDIRIGGRHAGKLLEYRLIPLMVCSVNIGSELSAAALTRGLGVGVRRTNICQIGFHLQDFAVLLLTASVYVLWILGIAGVIA